MRSRSSHVTQNAVVEKPEQVASDQVFGVIPEIRPLGTEA
jgi:hypothetical protein